MFVLTINTRDHTSTTTWLCSVSNKYDFIIKSLSMFWVQPKWLTDFQCCTVRIVSLYIYTAHRTIEFTWAWENFIIVFLQTVKGKQIFYTKRQLDHACQVRTFLPTLKCASLKILKAILNMNGIDNCSWHWKILKLSKIHIECNIFRW